MRSTYSASHFFRKLLTKSNFCYIITSVIYRMLYQGEHYATQSKSN